MCKCLRGIDFDFYGCSEVIVSPWRLDYIMMAARRAMLAVRQAIFVTLRHATIASTARRLSGRRCRDSRRWAIFDGNRQDI